MPARTRGDSRQRSSSTAENIVQTALQLFRQVGYHGTTVRDIARAADLNVGAMYHYFESKQALLHHIMMEAMQESLRVVQIAVATSTEPVHRMSGMITAVVGYHTRHTAEALVGNSELRSLEPGNLAQVVALRDEELGLFVDVIEQGLSTGEFVAEDPRQAASAIIAMCSAVAGWYHPGGRLSQESIQDMYVQMGLRLLGHRDGVALSSLDGS